MLAIECSSKLLSLAAFESGELKRELSEEAPMRQIERLAPLTQELLGALNWKAGGLQALAVSLGPGSFSGLRCSLAFAKGLCYATGAQMLGVSTLEAWAEIDPHAEVWLDARRGMVYRYSPGKESRMLPLSEAKAELAAGVKVLGDALNFEARPSAAAVGRLALKRLARGEKDDPAAIEPIYMRRPEVEILWEQRHGA
jgi:tRNA threonylcarbamoyladenosine biosynthesis protein TsaB